MNRRTAIAAALSGALLATAVVVPSAQAGNVAWGVSVGVPGFSVSAGQPYGYGGYFGAPYVYGGYGGGYYRPPVVAVARPYHRPYYRPYVPYAPYVYRPVVVAPRPVYAAPPVPYSYYGQGSY